MRRKIIPVVPAVAALAALAACGGTPSAHSATPAAAPLPACSVGHGSDGSSSTLAIRQHGTKFTGVYLNHVPGMPSDTAVRLDVAGTVSGNRLDSIWTAAGIAIHVTGRYTSDTITLDNPGGKFSTTVFHTAGSCPGGSV